MQWHLVYSDCVQVPPLLALSSQDYVALMIEHSRHRRDWDSCFFCYIINVHVSWFHFLSLLHFPVKGFLKAYEIKYILVKVLSPDYGCRTCLLCLSVRFPPGSLHKYIDLVALKTDAMLCKNVTSKKASSGTCSVAGKYLFLLYNFITLQQYFTMLLFSYSAFSRSESIMLSAVIPPSAVYHTAGCSNR